MNPIESAFLEMMEATDPKKLKGLTQTYHDLYGK